MAVMSTHEPPTMKQFLDWCSGKGIDTIVIGTADTNGAWIGKLVAARDVPAIVESRGLAFAEGVFAITRDGNSLVRPYIGQDTYFPRMENGFPDIFLQPDITTARVLPWWHKTAALNGSLLRASGAAVPLAPRNVLMRQVERAQLMGLDVRVGFEFEFYLLQNSLADLEQNGYRMIPISPRPYTYMMSRACADQATLLRIRQCLEDAGISVVAINPETGPGQYEINTIFSGASRAGDDAFLYKNAIKQIATEQHLLATFMARPQNTWPGSSCHIHQSLWRAEDGEPLTWSRDQPLSEIALSYLAGLLESMVELCALFAPTVNAYKRLAPYSWAGTTVTWGLDNRSTGLRVVGDEPGARRIEHRLPGADVNPYLAIAACLAGGLYGVENELKPGKWYEGDAYGDDKLSTLPRTLDDALDVFEASELARNTFGDDFVEHFVRTRRWEVEQQREHVSDWEIRHYVESA